MTTTAPARVDLAAIDGELSRAEQRWRAIDDRTALLAVCRLALAARDNHRDAATITLGWTDQPGTPHLVVESVHDHHGRDITDDAVDDDDQAAAYNLAETNRHIWQRLITAGHARDTYRLDIGTIVATPLPAPLTGPALQNATDPPDAATHPAGHRHGCHGSRLSATATPTAPPQCGCSATVSKQPPSDGAKRTPARATPSPTGATPAATTPGRPVPPPPASSASTGAAAKPANTSPATRTDQPTRTEPNPMNEFFDNLTRPCPHPPGTRVELTGPMHDDPDPIPVGSRGTVTGGNGSQLFVAWDDGRTLKLLVDEDPYRVLADHETPTTLEEGRDQ